ncbi:MAG: tRNA (guanosine(46)-N7)-methyltransferase TrmB [Aggregatilineales bacterium]
MPNEIAAVKRALTLNGLQLPWPTDWIALFGRSAPLLMEIGFGGGHFLVDLAQRRSDANVVGVERSHYSLTETAERIRKAGLTNIRLIHAEALLALAYLCPPGSLDALYVNFPDPFPKKAHAKRRLLTPDSLNLMATRLKPGALLTIATDVQPYAESIAHDLTHVPALIRCHNTAWVNELPNRIQTRYERKAREKGAACYYFEWERAATSAPITLSTMFALPLQEEIMPNAVLLSPLTLDEIAAHFQPTQHVSDENRIHWITLYREYAGHGLLIDTFIDEPLIEQRLGIVISATADEPGRYVVRLDSLGYPRPTPGTHLAVHLVVEWLRRLHPDTQIVHRAINAP